MAAAYTQEFLVNAFLLRYRCLSQDKIDHLRVLANRSFVEFGRDQFRLLASLTPERVKEYRDYVKNGGDPLCPSSKT